MDDLIKDGRVDVVEVMGQIRESIRQKRERSLGLHDFDALAAARLQEMADQADLDPDLEAALLAGGNAWNLSPDYRIRTHRSGIQGRLVVLIKRLMRPIVRLYTDPVLERQAQINAYLVQLCRALVREVVRLEAAQAELEKKKGPLGTSG